MFKNIIKSIVVMTAVASVTAGATLAAFTAQASSNGNTFSTGTAALMLWQDLAGTSAPANLTNAKVGDSFTNIYPGWTKDYGVKLQNTGTVDLVTSTTGVYVSDDTDLRTKLLVAAFEWNDNNPGVGDLPGVVDADEVGNPYQGWKTLEEWRSNPIPLTEVEAFSTQQLVLRFMAPSDLGSQYQNKTTVFNFVFDGTTDGAVQE